MTRRSFTWPFGSSKSRRRRTRRAAAEGRSLRLGVRSLRFEEAEPRLLLTHGAPELNAAKTATFSQIAENISISSNTGETIGAMITGAGGTTPTLPLGSAFAFFDTTNAGQDGNVAKEGIAVTGLMGATDGVWEYSTNSGSSWSLMPNNLSYGNALLLSGDSANDDLVRFLPNSNFSGGVSLQFSAWDQTDGKTPGSTENLTAPGASGGATAYSTSGSQATLQVGTVSVPPSFSLSLTSTLENNTVTASGGSPGGSNPNLITVPNFATNINLGNGGTNTVNFTVSDVNGNFGTLFAQNPAIDSQGTLTYQLKPDVFGTATLSVTATNGSQVSNPTQTTITVTGINDPPTINSIANPAVVFDTAGQQTIALSGITPGLNESSQTVTVTAQATVQSGDNANLLSNVFAANNSGNYTVNYTPVPGQNGTLHVTVTVQDNGGTLNGGVNTFAQTFMVTVRTQPSFTSSNVRVLQNNPESIVNWATNINPGYPGASGTFAITSDSFPGLFSVAPSISPSGTLSFTPTSGWIGTATLTATYSSTVNGQVATSNSQTFTIFVAMPPTAKAETYEVNYTASSTAASSVGLLNNDTDPNWGATMLTPTVTSQRRTPPG